MSLFDIDWRYASERKAMRFIKKSSDAKILSILATKGINENVRKTAIGKITDQEILYSILFEHPYTHDDVIKELLTKITDQNALGLFVCQCKYTHDHIGELEAIEKISDPNILERIVIQGENVDIRKKALEQIFDQGILENIICSCENLELRFNASGKVSNQDKLREFYTEVLSNTANSYYYRSNAAFKLGKTTIANQLLSEGLQKDLYRQLAQKPYNEFSSADDSRDVSRLTDQNLILDLAKYATSYSIRIIAIRRLIDLGYLDKKLLVDIVKNDKNFMVRDLQCEISSHDYIDCICTRCRQEKHDFVNDVCTQCGAILTESEEEDGGMCGCVTFGSGTGGPWPGCPHCGGSGYVITGTKIVKYIEYKSGFRKSL